VLYAAWKGAPLADALELGTAAAACSLSQPGATEGMRDYEGALALYRSLRQGG
jgi:sugar/nucleoside kinase (ribokinase family)